MNKLTTRVCFFSGCFRFGLAWPLKTLEDMQKLPAGAICTNLLPSRRLRGDETETKEGRKSCCYNLNSAEALGRHMAIRGCHLGGNGHKFRVGISFHGKIVDYRASQLWPRENLPIITVWPVL